MARLWDSSRTFNGGYSLESLSDELYFRKIPMKERFGKMKILKNGKEGKKLEVPDVLSLHRLPIFRDEWIEYSVFDAESTWHVYKKLEEKLNEMNWGRKTTMFDFYNKYLVPFGELLTDIEKNGIKVDVTGHLATVEKQALRDRESHVKTFISWATKYCEDAKYMNITSDAQKQQLLFAPAINQFDKKNKKLKDEEKRFLNKEREFSRENIEGIILEGKKKALKNVPFIIKGLGVPTTEFNLSGWPSVSQSALNDLCGITNSKATTPKYYTSINLL